MRPFLLMLVAVVVFATESFAAPKDFKGMFGSYRRDRFTENEARSVDFGIDLMLSTLLPVTPFVKSSESVGAAGTPMPYSTFFNAEIGAHLSLGYNWLFFVNAGYYNYDTRRQNEILTDDSTPGNNKLPLFHQFEMKILPIVGGLKYRFSREDIVPYLGVGVGMAQVTRAASYDFSDTVSDRRTWNSIVIQGIAGLEFYIAPRAGIRLEVAATYFQLPEDGFLPSTTNGSKFASFTYTANPIGVRYASGLFILF